MKRITINAEEYDALLSATDYVNGLLERCDNDEDSDAIKGLKDTLNGLGSIHAKIKRPRRITRRTIDALIARSA